MNCVKHHEKIRTELRHELQNDTSKLAQRKILYRLKRRPRGQP